MTSSQTKEFRVYFGLSFFFFQFNQKQMLFHLITHSNERPWLFIDPNKITLHDFHKKLLWVICT